MEDPLADTLAVGRDQPAGKLVQDDEARRVRPEALLVRLVHAVGGARVDEPVDDQGRATGHVVRADARVTDHVEDPEDVGVGRLQAEDLFKTRRGVFQGLDGVGMALGFTLSLFLLGAIREVIGSGTITFFQMGETVVRLNLLGESYPGILVMILPPGAFLALGFMLAGRNLIQRRLDRK